MPSAASRGIRSRHSCSASAPRGGACPIGSGTGSQTLTSRSGRRLSWASRAAHSAAARLSGEPSIPTVTGRDMVRTSLNGDACTGRVTRIGADRHDHRMRGPPTDTVCVSVHSTGEYPHSRPAPFSGLFVQYGPWQSRGRGATLEVAGPSVRPVEAPP
ncbi:hypothetical protein GCM10023083_71370 [Streptomyces phyllanthi]